MLENEEADLGTRASEGEVNLVEARRAEDEAGVGERWRAKERGVREDSRRSTGLATDMVVN